MDQEFKWLPSYGESANIIRTKNWAETSLGDPKFWSQNLRSTINIILNSKIPMYIWWGPDCVNIYNDAFTQIVDPLKHPLCFGMPAKKMWPEVWEIFQVYLDHIYLTGEAILKEDFELLVERDGKKSQGFFTFSFSPILNENAQVCGAMAITHVTTKMVDTKKNLLNEQEKFNSFLSQSPIPMCILEGPEHRFTMANEKYVELVGREVVGKNLREVFSEAEAEPFFNILDNIYETGEIYFGRESLVPLVNSDGTTRDRYIDFSYHPFRNPFGKIIGIFAIVQDVTNILMTKKTFEKSVNLLNAISMASPDFIFAKDLNGKMIFANPAIFKALGKTPEEIMGHTDREFLDDDIGLTIMVNDQRIMQSGITETVEEVLSINGKFRTYVTNKVPYKDLSGKVIGLLGVSRDVTELQETKVAFETSEQKFHTLTESLPQLVWGFLPDGSCNYLSSQWGEYTGMDNKVVADNEWVKSVVHPDDLERAGEYWMEAVKGLHPYDVEYRIRNHEGEYRWFKATGRPLKNASGEIIYWFGTCTDIEDQKRNEEVLRTINEVGQAVSAELDFNRLVQAVIDAGTTLSGAEHGAFFYTFKNENDEDLILHNHSGSLLDDFDIPTKKQISELARSENKHHYFGMPKQGVASYLAVPIISRTGGVLGGLFFGHSKSGTFNSNQEAIIKGIAAQTAIAFDNARLFKESKEAVRVRDEFLSIASHELKTPLTGLKLQTQMFTRYHDKNPEKGLETGKVMNFVSQVDRGLSRIVRLVDDMLDISRIQHGKMSFHPEKSSLASIVEETINRLQPELIRAGNTYSLEKDIDTEVYVDRFQIEQVITNLISNSIRYAPGTLLEISLKKYEHMIVLKFRDQGRGIKKEDHAKIFLKFERLISPSEVSGMGLGLYISKEIVERHGGKLRVESEENQGACFFIELPIIKREKK